MRTTERSIILPIITALLSVCMVVCFICYASKGFVNDKVDTATEKVNTVSEQISAINGSIDELKAADTELNGYIDALETAVAKCESDLAATNAKITQLEENLDGAEYATLTQLTETKTALEGQIATANTAIDNLKAADTTQNSKISALETAKASLESEITAIENRLTIVENSASTGGSCLCDTSLYATKTQLNEAKTALEGQLATVTTAITALQTANGELDTAITALETSVGTLEDELATTKTTIDTVKAELEEAIEVVETTVLAQLNTLKTATESDIATLKTDVAALKAKDTELTNKITALETTVATLASKDWANATFATLEQYASVQTTISGIEQEIDDVNASVTALETNLNSKIATDITAAINALRTELSDDYVAKITAATNSITTAYTEAIETAKTEITSAYTAAISSAISTSETSMKAWVNTTLAEGYYTIAEIDSKLLELKGQITTYDDSEIVAELESQKAALEQAKTDLTNAYKAAITEAIDDNNGVIDTNIENAISTAKSELNESITAIELRVETLETKIEEHNDKIAELEQKVEDLETKVNCLMGVHVVESYTINNDGTHTYTCTACQQTATEEHNYVDNYACECGDKIEITSLSFIIDDVEYDSTKTSASEPARITGSCTIKIKLYGTNLNLINLSHSIKAISTIGWLIDAEEWTFNADNTEATKTYSLGDFDEQTTVFELKYKNPIDGWSYVNSGVYYVYDVEAFWGESADRLLTAGTLTDALASDAAYIKLEEDVTLTTNIEIAADATLTFDLDGNTLTTATNKDGFYNNGTLTILNGMISDTNKNNCAVLNNGTLTMNGVAINGGNPFKNKSGTATLVDCILNNDMDSFYSAALTMEGGTVNATNCDFIGYDYNIYMWHGECSFVGHGSLMFGQVNKYDICVYNGSQVSLSEITTTLEGLTITGLGTVTLPEGYALIDGVVTKSN